MKKGFTLAEVLITLGIIGIVAALTLPSLIVNYQKRIVVTRLQKFTSSMKQAHNLISIDEPDYAGPLPINYDPAAAREWFNKYLKKNLKVLSIKEVADGILVALADGSGFAMYISDYPHYLFCVDYKKCENTLNNADNQVTKLETSIDGKNIFFYGYDGNTYAYGWDGTRENLITGGIWGYSCGDNVHLYCAKLIEYDGWEIKDDYPVKF